MKWINLAILLGAAVMLQFCTGAAHAGPDIYTDIRYQGVPVRNADGKIIRKASVIYAFKKIHPCPATMLRTGACAGWAIDHVISLECGGIDAVWNMQWLPNDIKSGADPHDKDRFERKIYAASPPFQDTKNCVNEIVK
jgi:hypothetical protein